MTKQEGFTERERELVFGIVRALPEGAPGARVVHEDSQIMTIELPERRGEVLRVISFSRKAVADLLSDEAREVKIEYLRRDLRRAATTRREYRYPRQMETLAGGNARQQARAERQKRRAACALAN